MREHSKITLESRRVAGYPGFGEHNILFDFYAKNQVPKAVEHLHLNAMYRASNGENVGIIGYPIFIGLNVSSEGVDFKCETVNVKNDSDVSGVKHSFRAGVPIVAHHR
jgi:hypothetical protein